jgi:hypothetical protein
MTMQQVFQDFTDFCAEPPPAELRDVHVLAFHLDPLVGATDVFPYNGTALIRRIGGLNPFFLDGFGIANAVIGHPTPLDLPTMVHIGLQIGRPNPIEGVLEFSDMSDLGGFDPTHIMRTESCDVRAEQIGDTIALFIDSDTGRRSASLRKTDLLHTKALP